jgi:FkbH-like protein
VTITEALEVLRAAKPLSNTFEVQLACGFTALHLKTLLAAHLQKSLPRHRAVVNEGIFGDLVGTIEQTGPHAGVALAIEWGDIDPRLSYREGGAWGKALESDLLQSTKMMLARIERAIAQLPLHTLVAISLPTLPLPPVFHPPAWQTSQAEILLQRELTDFAARLAGRSNVNLLSAAWLNEFSPPGSRFDLKSDLLIGFPYTLSHADRLASAFSLQLVPRQPLKGVITDLDNTLWSGLVGEGTADDVRWDPATRYYLHGLYQKLLAALSEEGILVGIASKNDPAAVAQALQRSDLLIQPEKIFPVEVHWAPKSESVSRILKKWNVLADSVAFVDDTPLELAEVASAHPGITCVQFPAGDYNGVLAMLKRLRDLCGKGRFSEEDALRLESIRQGAQFQEQINGTGSTDEFLETINAKITFEFEASPSNPRTLELVNKTNQFNLNGVRLNETEWRSRMERPGSFLTTVKYEDKFGALGTIAVLQGVRYDDSVEIETWVMSCRAFSRRIEHQTLKTLLERYQVSTVRCAFAATPKNGPLREFFAGILGDTPQAPFEFSRSRFEAFCPALHHKVEETTGVMLNG